MKILYLIHQFYPDNNTGTEKIFLNLAKMMQKYGHKVEVITYSFNKDSFYDQSKASIVFKEFVYQGIPVLAFRHKRIPEDINQALEDKDLSKVASYFISRKKTGRCSYGTSNEGIRSRKSLTIPQHTLHCNAYGLFSDLPQIHSHYLQKYPM